MANLTLIRHARFENEKGTIRVPFMIFDKVFGNWSEQDDQAIFQSRRKRVEPQPHQVKMK